MRTLAFILALALPGLTLAQVGQIKTLSGDVRIERAGNSVPARAGDRVAAADVLVTGEDGQVGVTFIDNTRLSLGPHSRLALSRFRFDETTHEGEFLSTMHKGTLSIISGQIAKGHPDAMKVKTPTSVLSVRGTRFLVKVD
jgi:hypothetical protein